MKEKGLKLLVLMLLPALIILAGRFYFFSQEKKVVSSVSQDWDSKQEGKKLKSFFNNKDDYESAFFQSQNQEKKAVIAGVISHHFLARDLIARFYDGIESQLVEKIVLVGPDHYEVFDKGAPQAFTTELSWQTPYGELAADKEVLGQILANEVEIDDKIFNNEHSIYIEVPFIKKAFPQARLIPLVVKNTDDYEKFIQLGSAMRRIAGAKTLLVVSSDFSHQADLNKTAANDKRSIDSLQSLRLDNLNQISCDCRACLAVMLGFLSSNAAEFFLVENKNSADFGSPDQKVTSYVSGYFLSKKQE